MAKLIYLVGPPGSNKSLFAQKTGLEVVSTSEIRHVIPNASEDDVFDVVWKRTAELLGDGQDCVVDCTNIRSQYRKKFLDFGLMGIPCEKECVIMATPIDVCLARNAERGNPVPEQVIRKMYRNWTTPAYWEGWNSIWAYYEDPEWMGIKGDPLDFVKEYKYWDQQSPGHALYLGQHCLRTAEKVNSLLDRDNIWERRENWNRRNLYYAALLHDCGKPLVQSFDAEGRAQYFGHHSVGAYEALFYDYPKEVDPIYVSNLITYHMAPYFWNNDKYSQMRSLKRWGRDFYEDILVLHEADEKSRW